MKIKIDGKSIDVEPQTSIVEAARRLGIHIPTLCFLKEFGATSSCRVCLVEIVGRRGLVTACSYPIFEGMEIVTNSPKVLDARKTNLELLLSNHNYDCINCIRGGNCELEKLAKAYDCNENRFSGEKTESFVDENNLAIIRDNSKCILCKRCVLACGKRQSVNAITTAGRGFESQIVSAFEKPLSSSTCVNCGQCILACPTGALREASEMDKLKHVLADKTKHVVVAPAPSVRVGIGEEFGLPFGSDTEGRIVSSLKKLGFDRVFDVNFGADLTIVEEANEFIQRLNKGGKFPMFTSCCPSWIDFAKKFYPEFLPNISTCKSPQQMFGAIAKTYYSEMSQIAPSNIVVVTIMPCTSKKTELTLEGMSSSGFRDVDISITVRELARFMKEKNVDLVKQPVMDFDRLLGESSGAGVIFGSSGGVMEASLRTVADIVLGADLPKVDYTSVRGLSGIKESNIKLGDKIVKVAVVSGLANTRKLLESIKNGKVNYHFIEVMACPGGCINGGGMPLVSSDSQNFDNFRESRLESIYKNDSNKIIRKSHHNTEVIELYKWLGKPNGTKVHKLLHTKN